MKKLTSFMLFATMSMIFSFSALATVQKYQPLQYAYEYDATVDAKTVGSVDLRNLGVNAIPSSCVIEGVQALVQTAFTSGGSATVTLGNSVDDDGYLANIFSLASANAAIKSGQVAGALLWDDTNDAELSYFVPSLAASVPKLKIGTAALTAGKAKFIFTVRCY